MQPLLLRVVIDSALFDSALPTAAELYWENEGGAGAPPDPQCMLVNDVLFVNHDAWNEILTTIPHGELKANL